MSAVVAHRLPSLPMSADFHSYEPLKTQREKEESRAVVPDPKPTERTASASITRAWKLVDANRILTKRKYVRKQQPPKAKSVSGPSSTTSGQTSNHDDEKSSTPTGQTERSLSWPSPQSDSIHTGGLRGDPFAAYPDNSPTVHPALDFLVKEIGSNAVPGTIHKDGFSPKAAAFMQQAFVHDLVFHALVAFAQGYDEVANTGTTEPSQAVLYHRGKATQLLCDRLKDPATCADDASILTTFLLIDNVWRYGENDIGRAHYTGLLQMIEMRGGLDKLGLNGVLRSIIEFAEVTDIGDSMRGSTAPPLPALQYCKHPFPAQICGVIARLPEGYAEIAMQGHLSIETMSTIVSLQNWLNTDPSQRSPAPHRQIGAARRCLAASYPLDDNRIEEAICFGLVITGMRSFHARFARMDHPFLDRIVQLGEQFDSMSARDSGKRLAEREHVAYMTMVAVEAADRCIELQPHVTKLVDLLLAREKFARSWTGMERAIKRFFWIDFAADKWKECWKKHLKYRAEEQARLKSKPIKTSQGSFTKSKPSTI